MIKRLNYTPNKLFPWQDLRYYIFVVHCNCNGASFYNQNISRQVLHSEANPQDLMDTDFSLILNQIKT